ncbi:hypothetical protein FHR33_009954 [Nonomuraea dietziae]|uniref:Uncharacterized protein n=1 Tax=Nonomuraea dietziae TaxID=65515 RepID=A0A7W5YE08_9ACTN|nr:hypothetical protein [Nonomuraea dietziae]
MRRLFEVLCGPLAQPRTPGVRFGPYRTVSFDGCSSLKAPDTARNRAWLGSPGHGGYPLLELMTLVETGTRALIGAVFGPTGEGETGCPAPAAPAEAGRARVMGQGLRRQRLPRPGRRHRGASPGPAAQQPAHPHPGPARRRLLSIGDRHPADPHHRGPRDGDLRGRHHLRRHLPPGHHIDRRSSLPGRRPGQPLPPAMGTRVGLLCAPPRDHAGADTAVRRPCRTRACPFTRWSIRKLLACLADNPTRIVVVGRELLRQYLRENKISFQRTRTWKDPAPLPQFPLCRRTARPGTQSTSPSTPAPASPLT